MRRKVVMGLALILAAAVGCKQQCFLTECDADHYAHDLNLPPNLEGNPTAATCPTDIDGPSPATVLDPERPVRHLSLAEALAMALEHGTVGSPLLNGTSNDTLVSFQGRQVASPESPIRVLALEPAAVGTDIEASLAKFDARWTSSITWQKIDEPLGTDPNIIPATVPPQNFQNGDKADFNTALLKPLPTGGVAGITFNTAYTNLATPVTGFLNPAYRPSLQFQFEQPLLQGFGVEINQLRATHPGSLLTPFNTGGRVEGILITRIRFDQQRAELERTVNTMLVNVEAAYWNLYGAYWSLYSRDLALRQAFKIWRITQTRFELGGPTTTVQEVQQTLGQFELFRSQRIDALGQVLESEHQLRALIGLPVEDGTRLVPVDEPTLASYQPDWHASLHDTLEKRPELVLARQDLKARQLDVINQKNLLLPDLRFTSTYNVNGFGTHLCGGKDDPNNALNSLASDQFNDWTLGLRLDVPIGFRDAHSAVRAARLRMAQSFVTLRDQEERAKRFLDEQYRALSQSYLQIQAQRAQREAYGKQLGSLNKLAVLRGGLELPELLALLEAQRFFAEALRNEYAAVAEYNGALARFEFAKGTIMEHDNVIIAEGNLPQCAQVRAVEHERQRTHAVVLRERANPVPHHSNPTIEDPVAGLPVLPEASAPSLPSLFAGTTREGSVPDQLPRSPSDKEPLAPAGSGQGLIVLGRPVSISPMSTVPATDLEARQAASRVAGAVSLGPPSSSFPSFLSSSSTARWRPAGTFSPGPPPPTSSYTATAN